MTAIEFTVEALQRDARGVIVCGRCCEADFGVGDVFTTLRRTQYERAAETSDPEQVGAEVVADIALRVAEIGFYGRSVERVYPGSTAGLRLDGDGLSVIESLELSPGLLWSLAGCGHAEPIAEPNTGRM